MTNEQVVLAFVERFCAGDAVSVFYEYRKPGATVTIAQLCELEDGRIASLLLVFDPRPLA